MSHHISCKVTSKDLADKSGYIYCLDRDPWANVDSFQKETSNYNKFLSDSGVNSGSYPFPRVLSFSPSRSATHHVAFPSRVIPAIVILPRSLDALGICVL